MRAGYYDFQIELGSTFCTTITWLDSNQLPVNLTAYTAIMQLRSNYVTAANSVLYLTCSTGADGRIVLGGTAGTITINIDETTTQDVFWTQAYYDLLLTTGNTSVRLLEGKFMASPNVTLPTPNLKFYSPYNSQYLAVI